MQARARTFLRNRAPGYVVVALLLLGWQLVSTHRIIDPLFLPPVGDILASLGTAIHDGSLASALTGTLRRFAVGYALAGCLGILCGVLLGYSRLFYTLLEPAIELLRPLPSPAIVPIFILILGIEDRMKISVAVFAAFFPVVVSTTQGVRGVDPVLIDTARTLGYRRIAIARHIILPASLPSILAGLRISLATTMIVTVVAEMLVGTDGMGYFVLASERDFQISRMYAGVFTLGLLGYSLNTLFVAAERRTLHWYIRPRS